MIAIDTLDKQLWIQQRQLDKHKQYFRALFHDNSLMLLALLIPAFLAGWKSGHTPKIGQMFKQFGKFAGLAVLTHLKGF